MFDEKRITMTITEAAFVEDCIRVISDSYNYIPMIMFNGKGDYWIEFVIIITIHHEPIAMVLPVFITKCTNNPNNK